MKREKKFMLLSAAVIALLSYGCATEMIVSDIRRIEIADAVFLVLPGAEELTESFDATQLLVAEYGDKSYSFQAQFESRPGMITIVAVTLLGGTLFSVTYDGTELKTEGFLDAQGLEAKYVLADVLLSFWDSAWLREQLQGAILEVSELDNTRRVSRGNETVIVVSYDSNDPWSGRIQFRNLERGYSLDIRTVSFLDI